MTVEPVRKIVIVGGGTAGWMAGAALGQIMGRTPGVEIVLVESEAIGTVGVGEATIPQIHAFNAMLGLDENEFMRETRATFKLGIEFVDWRRIGHRYVHPFGSYGLDMLGIEFHHFWLRALAAGGTNTQAVDLDRYSIAAMAGKAGKFARSTPERPNTPLARMGYAFQFDASLYAAFLRRHAERNGVRRVEGKVVHVLQDGESGFVTGVTLENGATVEGELFIDCSGFRSLLLGSTLAVPFVDWSKWLPCDRAVAMPCSLGGDSETLTRSTARAAGWQWRIPLQHRIGNGHVFSSALMDEDEALALLMANLDGEPLAEPNRLRFRAGYRERAWEKNVVALGLAGGFLEPLESTAIHLVQAGIARLLTLFPSRAFSAREIERYNAENAREYRDIRDFLVLHYKATERDDSEFWRYCRALSPPDGLAEKIAMFESSGRIFREHQELFTETSWLSVMASQGIAPTAYHPIAELLEPDETQRRLAHIRSVIASTVDRMPTQEQFLSAHGGAMS